MGKSKSCVVWDVTLIYLILGSLWLLFSNFVLLRVSWGVKDPNVLATFNGLFFLLTSVGLIYLLTKFLSTPIKDPEEVSISQNDERLRLIVENSRDMIFVYRFKPKFEFEYVSPAAKEITGYSPEDYYTDSSRFFELFETEDRLNFISGWKNIGEHKISQQICWTIRDGRKVWVEQNTAPLFDQTGQVVAIQGIVHDITERVRREEELAQQKKEIEGYTFQLGEINQQLSEAKRLKNEFLSNTSHELRTPLNAIIGFLNVIKDGLCESRDEELALIDRALEGSRHLLRMVNDLLDITKIEAGNLLLDHVAVPVQSLMDELETVTRLEAASKSLGMIFNRPEEPMAIFADYGRLHQVFLKLIHNSIKFTHQGTVTISAFRQGDQCHFLIQDTGIGISPEGQERIFENFGQVDGSVSRMYGGMGLGLPISRALVEKMGGVLTVESEGIGKGTTVHILLPLTDHRSH